MWECYMQLLRKTPILNEMWSPAHCRKKENKRTLALHMHLGNYGARWAWHFFNGSVLIHLPFGFSSSGCLPLVENHGFLHSNHTIIWRIHIARRACCFPVPRFCSSAGSSSPSFSFLSWCKEKPLLSVCLTHLSWKFCNTNKNQVSILTRPSSSNLKTISKAYTIGLKRKWS